MNRREIIKRLSIVPIAGSMATPASIFASNTTPRDKNLSIPGEGTIYETIGVDTIINCRGTFTIIGGSVERPEVTEAMEKATGYFVQYDELAFGIGKRLAELTQCEWGMISAGCAAGLKHVTAACVTGGNPEKLIRIPNLTGFEKTEVIAPLYSRNVYDHAIRNVGVKMVNIETAEELEKAINPRTAMIYLVMGRHTEKGQPLSLEVIAEIAKPHNIPILADAAAENLTIPPVHLKRGATIVAYSGGKAICGPQCAGILLGDKDILMAAWQASSPHHGPGRDNKVGKEEMMGMLAAVEAWTHRDHEAEWNEWLSWLDHIAQKVEQIEGVTTKVTEPEGLSNHAPVLHIMWNPDQLHITGFEVAEEVGRNTPRLAVGDRDMGENTSVNVTPNQMQPGQAEIVADRLFGVLSEKRSPRSEELAQATAKLTGHWHLKIDFFNSSSDHSLFLQQDGNWVQGMHKTDFEMLDLVGMVEQDEIKFRTDYRVPGNGLTYLFSGTVDGDTMNGSIYMGEYLTAGFTAQRIEHENPQKQILIPGGPPLAT